MALTQHQIQEFTRSKLDPAYFIENYCLIEHPLLGMIPFKLYPFQKDILKAFETNKYNISNKSRQVGMSTLTSAYALWMAMFHKKRSIIIISIKDDDAKAFLKKVKTAYYNLPKWMKDDPVQDNVHTLELTSGSWIASVASGSSAARGRTPSLLIIDEAAFIEQLEEIWTSAWPTLSRGGSAILMSTPNGVSGTFYDIWKKADPITPPDKRNSFNRIFVHWTDIPEYRDFGDTSGMTFDQIVERAKEGHWYKKMRPQFDDKKWAQEFEGDFLGSGNTVVNPNVLKAAKEMLRPPIAKFDTKLNIAEEGELWIWKKPEEGHHYIVGADIASGDGSDYSATQVLDINTGEQVAEYQGKINLMDYANFLTKLSTFYNTALLVPETTGLGIGLIQKLVYEIGYSNLFQFQNELTMKRKKQTFGWVTSAKTRPLMVQAISQYFNSQEFRWYSERLWNELTAFVWIDNTAEADKGSNDDLVMSFSMAAQNRISAAYKLPLGAQSIVASPDDVKLDEFGEVILDTKKTKEEAEQAVREFSDAFQVELYDDIDEETLKWLRS